MLASYTLTRHLRTRLVVSASLHQRSLETSAKTPADKQQAPGGSLQKVASQETQPVKKKTGRVELDELRVERPLFYHNQMEWLDERVVRISKPTKNVMQSGTAYTNCWKIEFDSQPRDEYWLMGWTGTTDPMSNMSLSFPSKEKAIEFCDQNKLQWFVEEQPERKMRSKSYADNFSWNKRTRLGSK